jgi:hypothetical protein
VACRLVHTESGATRGPAWRGNRSRRHVAHAAISVRRGAEFGEDVFDVGGAARR